MYALCTAITVFSFFLSAMSPGWIKMLKMSSCSLRYRHCLPYKGIFKPLYYLRILLITNNELLKPWLCIIAAVMKLHKIDNYNAN